MPHVPRQLTSLRGLPPELCQPVRERREQAPPVRASEAAAESQGGKVRVGLKRISLREYTVDPLDVYRQMFGKEAVLDRYTGNLVHTGPADGGHAPRPHGGAANPQ